jgi:endoglucanase
MIRPHILAGIIAGAGGEPYEYLNAQAALWATKLTSPLSPTIAAAYDQFFNDFGDVITAKADGFGITGSETPEASIKQLVQDAPDLRLENPEFLVWEKFKGFSHIATIGETSIGSIITQKGGTGYTAAVGTVSMPTGTVGPLVQAIFDAVCQAGVIVGWTPRNGGGSGYRYRGSAPTPTITIVGDGAGAVATPVIKIGRIYTGVGFHKPGLKMSQNDSSIGIGSSEYRTSPGAALGSSLIDGLDRSNATRVTLGSISNRSLGGAHCAGADNGLYAADTGHYVFSRSTAANYQRYLNGVKQAQSTQISGVPTSAEFCLLNRGVRDVSGSDAPHNWFWIGKALTDDEVLRLYYALNRFFVTTGLEVAANRTVQGSLTASNSLNNTSTITYTIDPSAVVSASHFDIEQVGAMPDASFANTFVASVTAACAASGGKYTFDGVKTINIIGGTITPLTWTRTVTATPATGVMHGFKMSNGLGVLFNQSTQILMQGTPAVVAPPTIQGVNLSGMEFSTGTSFAAGLIPTQAMVDVYASRGFNVIRLPFSWRRLQHELYGPLDVVGNGSGDAEKVKALVDYITITKGMYCILDPHDGAGRGGITGKLGSANLPVATYEDYWSKLITYLGINNQKIILNLTNEPGGLSADAWMKIANSLTAAIRLTGSLQHLHVPGTAATGAHSWVSSGNAASLLSYFDPANNYAFEVHQYLDSDSSGQKLTCTLNAGSTRMNGFYDWLATNNKKGFLGEVAAPIFDDPALCPTELNAILDGVNANPNMYGWSAWGGGGYWGNYYNRIEDPATGLDSVVMNLLVSKL